MLKWHTIEVAMLKRIYRKFLFKILFRGKYVEINIPDRIRITPVLLGLYGVRHDYHGNTVPHLQKWLSEHMEGPYEVWLTYSSIYVKVLLVSDAILIKLSDPLNDTPT
jgi:hypothetical protein